MVSRPCTILLTLIATAAMLPVPSGEPSYSGCASSGTISGGLASSLFVIQPSYLSGKSAIREERRSSIPFRRDMRAPWARPTCYGLQHSHKSCHQPLRQSHASTQQSETHAQASSSANNAYLDHHSSLSAKYRWRSRASLQDRHQVLVVGREVAPSRVTTRQQQLLLDT